MRILEARDGFIKFESNEKVAISSFLEIEDIMKKYIAQVVRITNLEGVNVGYAKILYLYDGSLYEYDKTLPVSGATIKPFDLEAFKQILQVKTPIKTGLFINSEEVIELESESFNKKLLACIDSQENCSKLVSNLKQEFSKIGNVLVIDMLGLVSGEKYTAAVDFKLPLNTSALEFMYKDCLNDATSDSKNLVKEIFADLAEYSKTVPFLPFGALKTIVDDMVTKSHIFKLLVLKNKLAKFDRDGYFAATANEVNNLNKIVEQKDAIIDLSELETIFQNRYLNSIYSAISKLQTKPQVFVIASNSIDKKNLKTIITSENVASMLVTHSRFKYINEIKTMFANFIIEPSFNANEVFKTYKTFLDAMPKDTYLLIGECTNYIPLVSLNKEFPVESLIETSVTDESNNLSYSELEEALNDPETEAINNKSKDLIDKITEDFKSENNEELNIFDLEAENEEDDVVVDNKNTFITKVHPNLDLENLEEVNSDIEECDSDEEILSVQNEDAVQIEESAELQVETSAVEISEEVVSEQEDVIEDLEQVEEIIEVEVPEEISELTEEVIQESEIEEDYVEEQVEVSVLEEETLLDFENEDLIQELDSNFVEDKLEDEGDIKASEEDAVDDSVEELPIHQEIIEDNQDEIITEVLPISDEEDLDEIIELDPEEIKDDDIIVDFTEEEFENEIVDPDALEKEIAEDVDKVFTTMKEDTISDSDLDFIDELNEESIENDSEDNILETQFEELPELVDESLEESFVEPLEEINEIPVHDDSQEILETKSSSTPIVPVYEAEIPQEDMVESDSLEQGDSVIHAKYGNGVVEKMIKYGSKTLYSINFDNVGRRLLDPTLTEIKKV